VSIRVFTMRYYELAYLISPNLSETEINALEDKIISFIQEEGGVLIKTVKPVKKKEGNLLADLIFQIMPEKLENLEKKIISESQVLRHLILVRKKEKLATVTKKPSRFPKKIVKPKVELKEIEKKLEEILGET